MIRTSKTIKLLLLSLAIISGCAVENNINNIAGKKDDIVYKDGNFTFSTKDLSQNYVESKLRKLNTANNGSALVRFLDFARFKETTAGNIPSLMQNIFQADNILKDSIRNNSVVIAKRNADPIFDAFAEVIFGTPVPTTSPTSTPTPTATPQTGEFQVNTYTTEFQLESSTAMDGNGNFVVTWTSLDQDGSNFGIYGQRYNSDGSTQGTEFQVNTYTIDSQSDSSTAMDGNGNFVVTWTSQNQDGSSSGIYGQRYNSDGSTQGTEFLVNTYTTGSQLRTSVAMNNSGNFVITWSSDGQDSGGYELYGQRYNSDGIAQGTEFQVNTYTMGSQYDSSTAIDGNGNFVVTWTSSDQDGSFEGIYGQRYDSDGVAQGTEFQVNTYTMGIQSSSSTAIDGNGNFVVNWTSRDQDGYSDGVYGQRYNSNGIAQSTEFQVNTFTTGLQRFSSTTMDSNGDFVVTWNSGFLGGVNSEIYGQRYDSNGIPR